MAVEEDLTMLVEAQCTLGECPRWDYRNQALWFVDIVARRLYCMDWNSKEIAFRQFDEEIGCFGFCRDGGMILGMRGGFFYVDDALNGALVAIADAEAARPWQRLNDGRCGPDGRFYAGSVNPKKDQPSAALYRLDRGKARAIADDFLTFNGLVFDHVGARVIFADTPQHTIFHANWDQESGAIHQRRPFAQFDIGKGRPDGAVQDCHGNIYTALYDGHAVVKLSRDGVELSRIAIPCKHPTALCFAGPDLDTLIITSARQGHDEAELAMYPKAGAIFAVKMDVSGFKEHLIEQY